MSTDVLVQEAPPPAKQLPLGVSNLLTFWWLGIAFAAVGAAAAWPMLPGGLNDANGISTMGQVVLFLILAGMVAAGAVVSLAIVKGKKSGAALMKLLTLIGMLGGAGLIALWFLAERPEKGSSLGDPLLWNVSLVGLVILLPYLFGSMALLTASTNDDVRDYFEAAPEEGMVGVLGGGTGQYVLPHAATTDAEAEEQAAVEAAADDVMLSESPAEEAAMEDAAAFDFVEDASVDPIAETQASAPVVDDDVVDFVAVEDDVVIEEPPAKKKKKK